MIASEVARCVDDPVRFNQTILGRPRMWRRQREILRSLVKNYITAVPTGNMIGKTTLAVVAILWFSLMRAGCRIVAAGPTRDSVHNTLWVGLEEAYRGAIVPLGGRMNSETLFFDHGWQVECFGGGSVESKSGRHREHLLAVVDEASGVSGQVYEALASLNPSRWLVLGNPLHPEGDFYELCEQRADDPLVNVIRVPSTESPHIHLPRSPWGMADATWLESSRRQYGESSMWWAPHVAALFPAQSVDALIPRAWIDAAQRVLVRRGGPVRLGVDLAAGTGADDAAILARDDNAVLALEQSPHWDLDATASRTSEMALRLDVDPARITYDAGGLGLDFANRLETHGIIGARPFKGAWSGQGLYANLRSACAWELRRRLDPGRMVPTTDHGIEVHVPQPPFRIGPEFMVRLRPELAAMKYGLDPSGGIRLEAKEKLTAFLKRSPDALDALLMTFAFPE